jgi:hypothetical protein
MKKIELLHFTVAKKWVSLWVFSHLLESGLARINWIRAVDKICVEQLICCQKCRANDCRAIAFRAVHPHSYKIVYFIDRNLNVLLLGCSTFWYYELVESFEVFLWLLLDQLCPYFPVIFFSFFEWMKERETADVQSNQSNLARRAFCKNASIL